MTTEQSKKDCVIDVSIIIPTYNEEKNIARCLDSVQRQTYAHRRMEVLIADALSEDRTRSIAADWIERTDLACRLLDNPRKIAEFGKMLGVHESRGKFLLLLDADNAIVQDDWIAKALTGFEVFPDLFGVASHYLKIPDGSGFNNFLTSVLVVSDPLAYQIARTPVQDASRDANGLVYRRFRLLPGYPCGANGFMFRKAAIKDQLQSDTFEEGQVSLFLSLKREPARFAMIDGYGIYHYYVRSLGQFFRKRSKIALKHMTRASERKTWVSYTGKRLYLYAFLNLTLIHPALYSVCKAIRRREILWLYWLPAAFFTTCIYGVEWVCIKLFGKRAW